MKISQNTYRTVHCKSFNCVGKLRQEWWEVECFKRKWWSFVKMWFVEKDNYLLSSPLMFLTEEHAVDYISNCMKKSPQNTVIREIVRQYI